MAAEPISITFPWQFDPVTGDSWTSLSLGSRGSARVTWDTASAIVAVAAAGCAYVDEAQSVLPVMAAPFAALSNVPRSQSEAHFGSGGYTGSMATADLSVTLTTDSNASSVVAVPLQVAAIQLVEAGGFPVGGPANLQGIVGLSWPNPVGLGVMTLPPFCTNGSTPSLTPQGSRTCSPASGVVPGVPLLQQLAVATPLVRSTVTFRFDGSTATGTRHGAVTLGAGAPTEPDVVPSYAILALQKAWGIAYLDNYVVQVPSLAVGGTTLNFDANALAGGTVIRGHHYGGWVVDSGTCFMSMPEAVLNATLAELGRQYIAAGGTMDATKVEALLETGRNFDGDARQPPYIGSVLNTSPPCVVVTAEEAHGLPTIAIALGAAPGNQTLLYTPDMYLYPVPSTQPRCVQLGLSANDQGVIGSLNMQGHTVFFDQDNKQIAFALNAQKATAPASTQRDLHATVAIGLGLGLGLGLPIAAAVAYTVVWRGRRQGAIWGRRRTILSVPEESSPGKLVDASDTAL